MRTAVRVRLMRDIPRRRCPATGNPATLAPHVLACARGRVPRGHRSGGRSVALRPLALARGGPEQSRAGVLLWLAAAAVVAAALVLLFARPLARPGRAVPGAAYALGTRWWAAQPPRSSRRVCAARDSKAFRVSAQ